MRRRSVKKPHVALAAALLAVPLAACGAQASTPVAAAPTAVRAASTTTATSKTPATNPQLARMLHVAKRRYSEEIHGSAVHLQLRKVAADRTLRADLQSGNVPALRAYVRSEFKRVWYHQHISRLRIVRGGQVLADAGVPFVVAPTTTTLRGANGRPLGTLEVSIQDVIGFVRYMHRNYPVDVVVRGHGAAHTRSSLPAATSAKLPDRGTVTLAGRRYAVGSFRQNGLGGEPLKVWILTRA